MKMILFKFGEKEHLERLRKYGEIYCRSSHVFREIEDGGVRGDRLEGVVYHYQANQITMHMTTSSGQVIDLSQGLVGQVTMTGMGERDYNIFSLYGCVEASGRYVFDERVMELGHHCLAFTDTQEFINRVKSGAEAAGLQCEYRLVEYFDAKERHGRLSVFEKQNIYIYQSEFRFALSPGTKDPIVLTVGSLEDISTDVIYFNHINDDISLEIENEITGTTLSVGDL